jgi:hypothetical protein
VIRPPAAQHAKLVPRTDNYPKRLDNEGAVFIPGRRQHKLMPATRPLAARLGSHVDSATWRALTTIPDPIEAEEFRTAGVHAEQQNRPRTAACQGRTATDVVEVRRLTQDSKMETPVHWKDHARLAL